MNHDSSFEDIEWLYEIAAETRSTGDKIAAVERLLAAAVQRMDAAFGALAIPQEQQSLTCASSTLEDGGCAHAYRQSEAYILSYLQRRAAPLLANRPPAAAPGKPACKVMAVPVTDRNDRQIGALAFSRPALRPDFRRSEVYLARHIAQLAEDLLESRYDPATGLLTRPNLEYRAAKTIAAHDARTSHAVIYIDIDDLHVINETFGFELGDAAIVAIAGLLQPPHVPEQALVARVGGDRFAVFLPACHTVQALQRAQVLQKEIGKLLIGAPQCTVLSASCGVAGVPQAAGAFAKALAAAELACRTARERGRGRSEIYLDVNDSMMRRKDDRLGLVRLRAALDDNRLRVFAQRVVPLSHPQRTRGIECLARLVAEDGAIVPPARFLSAARRYQLARAVDEWMIEHGFAALKAHAAMLFHGEIQVAFNLSEQSLRDDGFLSRLEDRVSSCGISPGLIVFEVAERVALRHVTRTRLITARLNSLGCRVALDDFGTSVGSLAQLQRLQPDRIKIDGTIVRDLLCSAGAESTVRAIVKRAATLEIECSAEHAQSDLLAWKLRGLGVDHAQGDCLHEAEPLDKLLEWLREEASRQLRALRREQ